MNLCLRLEELSVDTVMSNRMSYHRECYAQTCHAGELKRAKKTSQLLHHKNRHRTGQYIAKKPFTRSNVSPIDIDK